MTGSFAPVLRGPAYGVVVGVAGLIALAATGVPGRVALRVPPMDATRAKS
ncbi:hypothetical protein ABZZ17_10630 [Streptomyces sp. NPDC006512]